MLDQVRIRILKPRLVSLGLNSPSSCHVTIGSIDRGRNGEGEDHGYGDRIASTPQSLCA